MTDLPVPPRPKPRVRPKTFVFRPRSDITVRELATIIAHSPYAPVLQGKMPEWLRENNMDRHFQEKPPRA